MNSSSYQSYIIVDNRSSYLETAAAVEWCSYCPRSLSVRSREKVALTIWSQHKLESKCFRSVREVYLRRESDENWVATSGRSDGWKTIEGPQPAGNRFAWLPFPSRPTMWLCGVVWERRCRGGGGWQKRRPIAAVQYVPEVQYLRGKSIYYWNAIFFTVIF